MNLLELALLSNKPRAATITAKGKLKCATLGKKAFDRLLGPAVDIMKRNVGMYKAMTHRKDIQGTYRCHYKSLIDHLEMVEKIESESKITAA